MVHQADRLGGRSAAWARNPCHRYRKMGVRAFERAFRHRPRHFFADRAHAYQQLVGHTQQIVLGLVGIGHEAPIHDIGGPGDLRQTGGDQPAGAGFRGGDTQAPRATEREEPVRPLDHSIGEGHSHTHIFQSTSAAKPPATTSSSITPKPPFTCRSIRPIGHGFATSNSRNSTKPMP